MSEIKEEFSFDYETDLEIDLARLHLSAKEQTRIYTKWGKIWAKASKLATIRNEQVKTRRSELILEATVNWSECGFDKPPNAVQLEAYYRNDTEYQRLKREFHEMEDAARQLWLAVHGCEFRMKELEMEERLWRAGYFSKGSEGISEEDSPIATDAKMFQEGDSLRRE